MRFMNFMYFRYTIHRFHVVNILHARALMAESTGFQACCERKSKLFSLMNNIVHGFDEIGK